MSKKLMLLAAGVLSALAVAALPAIASAQEYEVHCPTGVCTGSITGLASEHAIELENDAKEKVSAAEVKGNIEISKSTTTTATVSLEFREVRETISGFKFKCNTAGAESGVIKTGPLVGHFVNLTTGGTNPGILLTNINVTFTCAGGLSTKTVTGNIIGTITEPNCNKPTTTNKVTFNIKSGTPGTQEHLLYTGTAFDLISGPHANDTTTSAQTGHGNVKWNQDVELTC
ncbi:MAG TPA: hypothetical protein VHP56_13075 [Solirubrobacterales bacterium]|jgi:hypothetical protein|nr:hypothetical protein [Solirubrobacterales bacterium]